MSFWGKLFRRRARGADVVANTSNNINVRKDAIKRITDQSVLADFAENMDDEELCIAAIEQIEDQEILADIARDYCNEWWLRKIAILQIENEGILSDLTEKISLVTFVSEGEDEVVKRLIQYGADVNERDKDGCTPLFFLEDNKLRIAQLLIDHGAESDVKNNSNSTPLHYLNNMFRHEWDYEVAEVSLLLIKNGADVNVKDSANKTPLHLAAEGTLPFSEGVFKQGDIENVRILLENGAEPNVVDSNFGYTPLHSAAQTNHIEMVQLLLDHGADVNIKQEGGFCPIDYAYEKKNIKMISLLENYGGSVNRDLFY
ncbi:MAG: hypothetical protein DIZ78_16645 [endosymbiont of Escarpia spicata]|uniref:Uncharacterized protein n=1 Tax=endosymbiont of Escarpia spicata TaxID=2200908 RepID=A0A370DD11_9GAMM|nr:MAG: hypothetical protein DIZ78_16645 [endosymbiont of Escarpia spicata]